MWKNYANKFSSILFVDKFPLLLITICNWQKYGQEIRLFIKKFQKFLFLSFVAQQRPGDKKKTIEELIPWWCPSQWIYCKCHNLCKTLRDCLRKRKMYPWSIKTWEVLGNPSPTPKRFPETRGISLGRNPREISGAEVMDFPVPPNLLIINPSTGMDQEIHPFGQGRIDSVKINPSRLRMRVFNFRHCPN